MKNTSALKKLQQPKGKIIKLEPVKEKGEEKKWKKYLTKKERKNLKIKDENLTTIERLYRIGILLKKVEIIMGGSMAA